MFCFSLYLTLYRYLATYCRPSYLPLTSTLSITSHRVQLLISNSASLPLRSSIFFYDFLFAFASSSSLRSSSLRSHTFHRLHVTCDRSRHNNSNSNKVSAFESSAHRRLACTRASQVLKQFACFDLTTTSRLGFVVFPLFLTSHALPF